MTENVKDGSRISQKDLSFQATEAMRLSHVAINGGFFNRPKKSEWTEDSEIIATSRFASTIITLIADGLIEPFIPDSGTSDTDTQE